MTLHARQHDYEINVRAAIGLRDFMNEHSLDSDAILKRFGLAHLCMDMLDAYIELEHYTALLEYCALASGNERFGGQYAGRIRIGTAGPFGYSVAEAPSVRLSLQNLLRYLTLYLDVVDPHLSSDGSQARLEWGLSPVLLQQEQFNDFCMMLLLLRMRHVAGADWNPHHVEFTSSPPQDVAAHRDMLGTTTRYDMPRNAIVISRELLDRTNERAHHDLYDMACSFCELLLEKRRPETGWSLHVKETVIPSLEKGAPSINMIARQMGVSVRSLQRKLSVEGTTYHDLLDGTRRKLAERYLTCTRLPMSAIADRLGFSSQANFTRSARRWFGIPPRNYRELWIQGHS